MSLKLRSARPMPANPTSSPYQNELDSDIAKLSSALVEARQDSTAMCAVVEALESAYSRQEVANLALNTVRSAFGWAYGSYWTVEDDQRLHFDSESGDAGEEFRQVTLTASFAEGVGLSGRAWQSRDLFFTADLGEMTDCVRAPVAQKVGVKSGVCFPIMQEGHVVGTMDFFATETLTPSDERLNVLRSVGRLVSTTFARLAAAELEADKNAAMQQQAQNALRVVGMAQDATTTVRTLGSSSEKIQEVTAVINDIAKKTNLLALNATIEAARAGQAGKGFGVVAGEVKALAKATATATETVAQQIKNIRDDTDRAIKAMDSISTVFEDAEDSYLSASY